MPFKFVHVFKPQASALLSFIKSLSLPSSENSPQVFLLTVLSFPHFTSPTCPYYTLLSCRDDLQVIHHSNIHYTHNPRCKFDALHQCCCHCSCSLAPIFLPRLPRRTLLTSSPAFSRAANESADASPHLRRISERASVPAPVMARQAPGIDFAILDLVKTCSDSDSDYNCLINGHAYFTCVSFSGVVDTDCLAQHCPNTNDDVFHCLVDRV